MTLPSFDALQVGDALAALELPPVSRLTLALYCGSSGDHNPIHVDADFAAIAGLPDVNAHGMLSMDWLALARQLGATNRDPRLQRALCRHDHDPHILAPIRGERSSRHPHLQHPLQTQRARARLMR